MPDSSARGVSARIVDFEGSEGELEGGELVIFIIDGEVARKAEARSFAAQQAHAKRMEGADPRLVRIGAGAFEEGAEAVAHLLGGLIGEGDGEDRGARNALLD